MMSTLIPFCSHTAGASEFGTWLSVVGTAALQMGIVLEGDAYGHLHSKFLLIAGLCLAAWFGQLYVEGILSTATAPYFYLIAASFAGLYTIRQSKKLRTIFVVGEYILILFFILSLGTLTNISKVNN